jgi:hypothetical protein
MKNLSELNLGEFPALTALLQVHRQSKLQLYEGLFFGRELKELARRSDPPARLLQALLLVLVHGSTQFIVLFKSLLAHINHSFRRRGGLLAEDLKDHNRIRIYAIHNPPSVTLIDNSELVTPGSNRWHGTRMRQSESLAILELPEKIACLESCRLGEGRALDLAFEPDERLIRPIHHREHMSEWAYCQ